MARFVKFTAGLAAVAGVGYAASNVVPSLSAKKENVKATFSYVGYEPTNDRAIIQFTDEKTARTLPAEEVLRMEANPQLISARRSVGKY
eukprot:CAMPEP_0181318194 /NCGR_PEP_ID=MMETSP1101-20121128/16879_1 /TAXON_ID=46948 /ORGANISM="Rhodomonas abbreviata, Strain Caron Lab Isolate" /LENGTH=88 /DNA_ID=CAMNT_0023425653 /DNA_START=67 /DNA_END=333 /DNA_ORIENTATION=+